MVRNGTIDDMRPMGSSFDTERIKSEIQRKNEQDAETRDENH